ncbi:MAG: hypothetical protein MJ181_10120 [Treponema sp.]|nr:hypothetical protein [Treponema sp.]
MTDEENIRLIECCDDRFEIIKRAREHILDATNIESRPEEMQVLDNFLFRCWQMGWLKNDFHQLEKENEELKKQIEKMKCCENCKKYFNDYKGCSDFDCDFCDHWEMKE